MDHPDANSWLEACSEELAVLRETRTYVPIHIDDVRNPVLSRSDELPTSFGGVGHVRSRPTRVGMRPMMRIEEYV